MPLLTHPTSEDTTTEPLQNEAARQYSALTTKAGQKDEAIDLAQAIYLLRIEVFSMQFYFPEHCMRQLYFSGCHRLQEGRPDISCKSLIPLDHLQNPMRDLVKGIHASKEERPLAGSSKAVIGLPRVNEGNKGLKKK